MRVAISLSTTAGPWGDFVTYIQEAERLGVDVCFIPEAWGTDAVSRIAYLAAKTERIVLGSGIIQIATRTPAMMAQTERHLGMMIIQQLSSSSSSLLKLFVAYSRCRLLRRSLRN